jgi:hypothetical protein
MPRPYRYESAHARDPTMAATTAGR